MALRDRLRLKGGGTEQEFLDHAADMDGERTSGYGTYQSYYDGDHATQLTNRAKEFLEHHTSGLRFHENFTEPVVDVMAERLEVTGFTTGMGDDTPDEGLIKEMGLVWEQNRMGAGQSVVHTQALIKGDAFVIVDWHDVEARPRITFQPSERVKVVYSDEQPDELSYASKAWNSETTNGRPITRLNVYWPDRVERWFRLTQGRGVGGWVAYTEDARPPVIPWVDKAGAPLGVPVFHFANKPLGAQYGRSEIHSVIPQQNLLNKQIIDLALLLDSQGWKQRWATGIDPTNATFKNVLSDLWLLPDPDSKVGQFDADDPRGMVVALESTISRIARRSRTPLHLLVGGDMPSGEALKSAEAGLVAKVKARHEPWGNVWEDVQRLSLKLKATRADLVMPDDLVIGTDWSDPVSRNEKEEAETAVLLKDVGVSNETLMRKLGFDPEEEKRLKEEELEAAAERFSAGMDPFGSGAGLMPQGPPRNGQPVDREAEPVGS